MTTSTRFRALIAATTVSVLASSFASLCTAADTGNVLQVVVKYGDLNLSNPQGAAKLYSRIASAAHEVCKPFDIDIGDFRSRLNACVHQAIMGAVIKVDRPELTAVYNAKNNQALAMTVAATQTR